MSAPELFNVVQFFADDCGHEYVARDIEGLAAVRLAKQLTERLGARIGTTLRVIITDSGDNTVFQWNFGAGVTWPTPAMRRR